ncbi:MAG: replication and repair protein RecF protein, partial [Patescibacteria group bacterium]|nr:replication and repair protein RecF protein [Patescibacteria group bacterium]
LASTKSFRAKDRDLIRHEQDFFRLVAHTDEAEYALGLSVAGGGMEKRITHDGTRRTLVGHVGQIQVVLFEPTDLELVSGSPEGRRRYLDFLLCQTDRGYLKTLQQYRRVLKQRNALLDGFEIGRIQEQMFAWDMKFAELAIEVHARRQTLLGSLNEAIPLLYGDIAGKREALELVYVPSVAGVYAEEFVEALTRNLTRDLGAGFTTIGPHREDFKVRFKNNDISAVASRGEVRTVVLAMKLAELTYAQEQTGIRPVLLLDDVFSELDRDRRSFLLERLSGHQTIITTTDADAITREFATGHSVISTEAGVPAGGRVHD